MTAIDLVTVFNAILTRRQTCELECLYENLMLNNFHKTAVLKKYHCKLKLQLAKDCTKKCYGSYLCLSFFRCLLKIFHIFVCNFSQDFLADKCIENLKTWF